MRLTLLAASCAFIALSSRADDAPIVAIDSGRIEGVVDRDVVSFKGVPYAAPPVGEWRWRPPQPVTPWTHVRKADKVGAICMQKLSDDNGVGPPPASEDCLTLNVYTPVAKSREQRHPVMFWIHGGGFVNGSGTAALYDGTQLARQGVVVVTINYRLGRFGFYAHTALAAEHPDEPQANYALMDMIAALEWVKRNAAAFGGDPQNVTIFGESAGGAAVNQLMIAPRARGLFHKAIAQSGLGRERRAYLDRTSPEGQPSAFEDGRAFAGQMGLPDASAAALRALSADAIIAAGDPDAGTGPVIEGLLVPENVEAAFRAGRQASVPYLAGSNALEFPFYSESLPGALGRALKFPPEVKASLIAAYGDEATFKLNVLSDVLFTEPARHLVRLHADSDRPGYLYRFSVLSKHAPERVKATPHAQERQHVFKTLNASNWPTDENDAAAAELMSAYWVSFATTGDPNGAGRPEWPRATADDTRVFEFTNHGPRVTTNPTQEALDVLAAR
jgi:para-nitrobenzyl esterase